jgi:histone deacetylase complex subunit SAP18
VSFSGRDLMTSISSGNVSVNGNGKVSAMDMELDDGPVPTKGRPIEEKTLEDYGFITGDLLSVSLFVPEPKPSNRGGPHSNNGASIGAGGGGPAPGFGRREGPPGPGRESNVERADAEGHWARGEALPPQNANAFRGPRGSFGRDTGDEPRDRDRAGFGGGIGIRGAGRRSPGPDRERNGFGRKRSRSPEARDRRESWSRR